MSELLQELAVDGDVIVDITVVTGDIVVSESDQPGRLQVRIDGAGAEAFRVEQRGNVVSIAPDKTRGVMRRFFAADVTLTAPSGIDVQLNAGSGDVIVNCPVRNCDVVVASGDVKLRSVAGDASVKSASGDIHIDQVDGRLRASSASGDVRIGRVGADCSITSASGDVSCEFTGGPVEIKTASGDATLTHVAGDSVDAKTLSGTLRIGVPAGRRISFDLQSLAGELRNNLTESDSGATKRDLDIHVKTVSGDVHLNDA